MRALDGQRFGRWFVVREDLPRPTKRRWLCRCNCGVERFVLQENLSQGKSQSCGCLFREQRHSSWEARVTHGASRVGAVHREFRIWTSMRQRCSDPKTKSYARYGGRGIRVCDRWEQSYQAFIDDMGPRPTSRHSIDRIDVNGHYEPSNCRWATPQQQARNTRRSRAFTLNGVTMSAKEWSERTGINYQTIMMRIHAQKWSIERALTTPPRVYK